MLGARLPALDLSGFLQLACACLFFIAGWFYLNKKPALLSFFLNTVFEGKEEFQDRHHMRNGSDAGGVGVAECAVCLRSARKKCSRCKSVWYCSQACQSKHWKAEHKSKCKEVGSADKFDALGTCSRKKSSAISLVPSHGTRKVLKEPKKILFPYDEFVKLFDWEKPGFPPCGLLNCGNSCFANVVLQCLAFTRPLVAYLLEKDHTRGCLRKRDDWCFLCELQIHIKRASESSQSFSPINILSRLPNIGGNLGYGRQEDAHEFMRFAIDTMRSICLDEFGGEKAVDPSTQETTIIQYIFGGHLRSQVICTKCDVVSNRYENMMDLTVEIHGDSESLEECLDQFTIKEWLDGENMYKCDGCNDYVKAWKRLTVHQAPNILTIALKRFQSGRFGKLNKRVTFPEYLDLTPYMSGSGDGTDQYTLYGVVVHLDMLNASFFGHYICYTKDYRGLWYRIDDCKVSTVEVEEVLAQNAYMLLYHRINPRKDPFVKPEDPTTNTHSITENDPERSKIQNSTNSSSPCGIISSIMHPSTGHDRHLTDFTENESEDSHGSFIIDSSFAANPSGADDANLEHSNLMETASLIKTAPPNPAEFLSAELEPIECEEPALDSHSAAADLRIEEGDGSVDAEAIDGLSSSMDEDMIMADASTAPITTTTWNVDEGSTLALGPQPPEPTARTCGSSGPANGVISTSYPSLGHKRREVVSMDGSRGKMEPIFARGFLDKPFGKKSTSCERTARPEDRGASSSSNSNGYSNGHLNFEWDTKMTNGNANDDTISSDSNMILSPPSISNSHRCRDRAECNGISSFHDNEIDEFQREPPCSSFETSAELRRECTINGDGLQFETDEVLSSYCTDNKTLKSKSFERHRDENRRLIKSNGFSTADFSD